MNDNVVNVSENKKRGRAKSNKPLNVRNVKRRMSKISAGHEPKVVRKKQGRLAIAILNRMASGEIKNPEAVAKAFVDGSAKLEQSGAED